MKYRRIVLIAFGQAVCTAIYVVFIASVLRGGTSILEGHDEENVFLQIFGITVILTALVISAGITGSLVFGYAVLLAIQHRFRKAVLISSFTIGFLILIGLLAVASVAVGLAIL